MKQTSRSDLDRHLQLLGMVPGEVAVVHSRLVAFGRLIGADAGEIVLSAVRDALGPTGTLVAPLYSFDDGRDWSEAGYRPSSMGLLGPALLQMPGAVRSTEPIHGHIAVGARAADLMRDRLLDELHDSDFDRLYRADAILYLLGCSFAEGATYLHHVEALRGVPYRNWVEVARERPGGGPTRRFRYFARTGSQWTEDFDVVVPLLRATGVLSEVATHYGTSYRVAIRDLHDVATRMLEVNPYALVRQSAPQS